MYVWRLVKAVILVTTTHKIRADPKFILMMKWEPETLRSSSKLIRKYVNIMIPIP